MHSLEDGLVSIQPLCGHLGTGPCSRYLGGPGEAGTGQVEPEEGGWCVLWKSPRVAGRKGQPLAIGNSDTRHKEMPCG